jgi:hypothetical protein
LPNSSLRPNSYLAVTASSVRESAFAGLHAMIWLMWTRYALLEDPNIKNLNFSFKVISDH